MLHQEFIQIAPHPKTGFFDASENIKISLASSVRLKSMKLQLYTLASCRNINHILRSSIESFFSLMWWWGLSFLFKCIYSHWVNALPGMIALPRKLRKPQICSSCFIVTFLFFEPAHYTRLLIELQIENHPNN